MMKKYKKHWTVFLFSGLILTQAAGQITVQGTVTASSTGKSLPGAHIRLENTHYTVVSNETGAFDLHGLRKGTITLTCSYLGFEKVSHTILLQRDTTIHFKLNEQAILGNEVNITGTRAGEKYPTAHSTITSHMIESVNMGQDLPYIIQSSPSVTTTSDAGNGIGYTGLKIRGSDLTRINVTINGIPLNDAESQGVWFVDLPDLAASTENIQIQRGVGTSTNGAGAFGATINILTDDTPDDPYGALSAFYGSYNTWKTSLKFGTGIMKNGLAVDGRASFLSSDGYIDRASSNLKSFYLSAGYHGKHTTLRLVTFSGLEKTYQAWEGVPMDSLATNRTFNPAGMYLDSTGQIHYYDNQTDNYRQNHYQLLFSQQIGSRWNLHTALFLTNGKGYYENYKQDQSFADYGLQNVILGGDTLTETDLVNQKWLDNHFYGLTYSLQYRQPGKIQAILGGALLQYYGLHYGKVIWARFASGGNNEQHWYDNNGLKNDINIYAKGTWQVWPKVSLFGDLQYRYVDYRMAGTHDDLRLLDQSHVYHFFNPKTGLFVDFTDKLNGYFSFSVGNREPSRNNFRDADPGKTPLPERLYDYEMGARYTRPSWSASINLFYMDYKNQLALTGEINNVGEAIMVNVPESFRTGIELSAGFRICPRLQWDLHGTVSWNKIRDFTGYVDDYDSAWNFTGQTATNLGTTDLSFSPGLLATSIITYKPVKGLQCVLTSYYTGKQYIDNTSSDERSLHPYFVNNLQFAYSFKLKPFSEIALQLMINNVLSQHYESNAWVYRYNMAGQPLEMNGYFPQALINCMAGITVKL